MKYLLYSALVTLSMWLASGTLLPYAATLPNPIVEPTCGYLMNWDNGEFEQIFYFLRGDPPEAWSGTTVLRRILFPVLAYYPMQVFGFVVGGFLTSLLIHLFAGNIFLKFLSPTLHPRSQIFLAIAMGTYPGVAYFGPSPYSYSFIVPFSLLAFLIMICLDRANTVASSAGWGLVIGILCLGYDLTAYVLPIGCIVLASRKRYLDAMIYSGACLIAPVLWMIVLNRYFSVAILNANTVIYNSLLNAYIHPERIDIGAWLSLLGKVPSVFVHNFLFSSFLILPTAALVGIVQKRYFEKPLFTRVEGVWLGVILFVWLFNNAAPPYPGFQLRGVYIARLYEPAFVVLLLFCARSVCVVPAVTRVVIWFGVVIGQISISIGPWLGLEQWSADVYSNFYQHSSRHILAENIRTYGKYPIGTCPKQKRPAIL